MRDAFKSKLPFRIPPPDVTLLSFVQNELYTYIKNQP